LRELLAIYEAKRDLLLLGAYAKGTDKELDRAIERMPQIEAFLGQSAHDIIPFDESVRKMATAVK
jgi:flagellar biosynthesis/type III secretory pathway ATPase